MLQTIVYFAIDRQGKVVALSNEMYLAESGINRKPFVTGRGAEVVR
jgi:hypothetical protein